MCMLTASAGKLFSKKAKSCRTEFSVLGVGFRAWDLLFRLRLLYGPEHDACLSSKDLGSQTHLFTLNP